MLQTFIYEHQLIIIPICTWLIAQLIKVIIDLEKSRKINYKRLIGAGGMPSSHTALVTSLTTMIALKEGCTSNYFAISLIFSLVVIYDAMGVRRETGEQAKIINKMVGEFKEKGELEDWNKDLKELIGHTPIQVGAGAILGILMGLIFYTV